MTKTEATKVAKKFAKSGYAAIEIREAYPEHTFTVWALDRTRSPVLCGSLLEYDTYYKEDE